ncbi:TonB-dependent receptor [Microscilla marina]|uniref:Probable outer membrane receptor protein, putative n=1 Tax=Microscilla marina ATCC 23134 TaxID=313606 RepID=A1ZDS3_MICM2|nr:TonB-dependent receptor [Microscilla marina]EAY31231.1 probable outer membrane receptor protein, putative [Microscilla marina ATCC 23134]
MIYLKFIIALLLWTVTSPLQAQTLISGMVTDEKGEALAGANVSVKNTYDGTSTNIDGQFQFNTPQQGEAILVVAYISFKTFEQKITLSGKPLQINVRLKEEANELNTVVITAGAFEASDEKRVVVLNSIDIATTAGGGAGDLVGALQTLPGAQTVGETEGLFVRGGAANETKTLIDGLVVQNPFYSSVPDVPQRGRFSPFLFKGTVFSTGGYSAQYGQALSSVLVLNSQDLAEKTQTNIDLMTVGVGAGHTQRWKNTSLSLNTRYTNLEPVFQLIPQNADWKRAPESVDGSIIFRQKTSKTGIFKLYSTYNQSNLAMNYQDISLENTTNALDLTNDNTYINTSWKEALSDRWFVQVGGSYSHDHDLILLNGNRIFQQERLQQGRITVQHLLGENSGLTFGGEVQRFNFDDGLNQLSRGLEENYLAGFVEADVFFTRKLAGRFGVRMEKSEVIGQQNIAPRLSLAYKTGKYSQVSAAYGQFFQTPQTNDLIQLKTARLSTDLQFEQSVHYLLNYQWMVPGKRTFRIEGYYKQYDDLVKNNQDLAQLEVNNNGYGFARGIELFWRDKQTFKNVDYWVSYSFLDTEREFQNFPTLARPGFAANHTLSMVYKQYFSDIHSYVGFTYTFSSGRAYFNPNNPEFHGDTTPAYHNLSLTYTYITSLFDNFTILFASINNVLGVQNVFGYRYAPDGTQRQAIGQAADRGVFIGMFVSIGKR